MVILPLGLVFALAIRKIRSGEGKTKYVFGSVGERAKTEIEATNQLASVNRDD